MTSVQSQPNRYQADRDVICESVGDDVLLLHLRTNRFFELNRTAARVWQLVSTGADVQSVVQRLAGEFNGDITTVKTDVEALIGSLQAQELLTTA